MGSTAPDLADEGDWLELLVASERIEDWLDVIKHGTPAQKRKAVFQLAEEVNEREAYAEEAAKGGAVNALTLLIAQSEDEELIDTAAGIIAACSGPLGGKQKLRIRKLARCSLSGPCDESDVEKYFDVGKDAAERAGRVVAAMSYLARPVLHFGDNSWGDHFCEGKRVQKVVYGQHTLWIQEGALGDGLGARIWIAAHILCRRLLAEPGIVISQKVLEIGSGCGLCGLLAAKLGAEQVTLTDYEDKVLENLRACAVSNTLAEVATARTDESTAATLDQPRARDGNGWIAPRRVEEGKGLLWDMGRVRVRFLDWSEALDQAEARKICHEDLSIGKARSPQGPRNLSSDETFPVIIGSDLLYELFHAELVAAVLKQRLSIGGKAYIALAVRRQAHLDRLLEKVAHHEMTATVQPAEVNAEDVGIVGREHEYEGGFVVVVIQHQ